MNVRRFFFEAATLIVAAVLCALVSNAVAGRERKMVLKGFYPNAQKVPAQATETTETATSVAPVVTTAAPVTTTTAAAPPPTTATVVPPVKTTTQSKPATQPVKPASPAKPDISRFVSHPDKPYVEIHYSDVRPLYDAGVLFLDARRTSIYDQGHIAGARPFSVWESDVDDRVRALWEQRQDPKDQALPIVVYCSGGECEDSHMLAQKLWGVQFNNVYVYKDGYPDWVAHSGAVRTGSTP